MEQGYGGSVVRDEREKHSLIIHSQHGLIVHSSALATRGLAALEARPLPVPQTRWLRFPDDRSVGKVKVFEEKRIHPSDADGVDARGMIKVPVGMVAALFVNETVVDFSFLATCDLQTALSWLGLSRTQITDAGLCHLERLTNLVVLDLTGTEITDAGLRHLECLTNLAVLDLTGTEITDAGLRQLQPLIALETLQLNRTRITAAGLRHFVPPTGLTWLIIEDTKLPAELATELAKRKLPGEGKLTPAELKARNDEAYAQALRRLATERTLERGPGVTPGKTD